MVKRWYRYKLCYFINLILFVVGTMGCIGYWMGDNVKPTGEYVSFTMPEGGSLCTLNISSTSGKINVDWGDGAIKSYIPPINEYRYLPGDDIIKVYSPATLTKVLITDPAGFENLDYCTALKEVELDFLRCSITLPPQWGNIEKIFIEGYSGAVGPTQIINSAAWTKLRYYRVWDCELLTSVDTHSEWTSLEQIEVFNCAALTEVSISSDWANISIINFSGCALTEATVNDILIICDSMGKDSMVIDLTGGTNASPTGDGLIAYNNLINKGNTVLVNL